MNTRVTKVVCILFLSALVLSSVSGCTKLPQLPTNAASTNTATANPLQVATNTATTPTTANTTANTNSPLSFLGAALQLLGGKPSATPVASTNTVRPTTTQTTASQNNVTTPATSTASPNGLTYISYPSATQISNQTVPLANSGTQLNDPYLSSAMGGNPDDITVSSLTIPETMDI